MTIDERLKKLTARHEALMRTLESLAALHRRNRTELAALQRQNEEHFAHYNERFARDEERLAQLMDAVNRLVRVAELRERRMDGLEGGNGR